MDDNGRKIVGGGGGNVIGGGFDWGSLGLAVLCAVPVGIAILLTDGAAAEPILGEPIIGEPLPVPPEVPEVPDAPMPIAA